jgi:hypothetical protein
MLTLQLPFLATVHICGRTNGPRPWLVRLGLDLGLAMLDVCDCDAKDLLDLARWQDDQIDWLLREATDRQLATHLYGPRAQEE